jgi:predicted nucleic acid-binding protein
MMLGTHCPVAIRWSNLIHDEWTGSLLKNRPDLQEIQLERTKALMDRALPDALVTGFEDHINAVSLPDPNDRHVLAAAIKAHADTIVTWNVKDFPAKTLKAHGLIRQTPDAFVMDILMAHEDLAIDAIKTMRQRLKSPPRTIDELLHEFKIQGLNHVVAYFLSAPTLKSRL